MSGGFFPAMMPPTSQDIFMLRSTPSSPSGITFPGHRHQGDPSFEAHLFGEPRAEPAPEPAAVVRNESSWENSREQFADTGIVTTTSEQVVDLPHATMRYSEEIETSVVADDPSTAGISRRSEIVFEYDTETVRVRASSAASAASAHARTLITVDGETLFNETWRRGVNPY